MSSLSFVQELCLLYRVLRTRFIGTLGKVEWGTRMVVGIDDSTTIEDVQTEFSRWFPYLRLEFLDTKGLTVNNPDGHRAMKDVRISEYCIASEFDTIDIDPFMSVRELETLFRVLFGLRVEVFRQSGHSWLRTMLTNDWTLQYQNEQGALLSANLREPH